MTLTLKLPFAFAYRQFCLDLLNERTAGLIERFRQFENRGERGLLLAKFEDAHIGAAQVGFKAELFLRQAGRLA